jgi:hypothetical protein
MGKSEFQLYTVLTVGKLNQRDIQCFRYGFRKFALLDDVAAAM